MAGKKGMPSVPQMHADTRTLFKGRLQRVKERLAFVRCF